jgi:hypothetical protein
MKPASIILSLLINLIVILTWSHDIYAYTVKITDVKDNVIELKNPKIDYTSYSVVYTSDYESSGIRIIQGQGTITVNWDKINELNIIKSNGKTYNLKAEILMVDGKKILVELVGDSKNGLNGQSELGFYKINLYNVKTIVPIRSIQQKTNEQAGTKH